jgi:hypothetical protein
MIYGSNILSSVVANWQVTNGTVTTESIMLDAGGYAVQTIDLAVLQSIPEYMMLSVVATPYADPYAMGLIAELKVLSETGVTHVYTIPIVDTGNGVCSVDFPVKALDHTSLTFTFKTTYPVVISDYALFPPKLTKVDLTEVLDRLPRLLSDYNQTSMEVTQKEDIVALISAYITETTELTGKFTLSYVASEPTELIIRIKDNEISELYTPMYFSVNAGHGTIGIPHAYLSKLQGYHNFTVTAQVVSGSIKIDPRRVMYVIDGGRIAYNVMDIGSIVYDVTVRKLESESQISFIYAACIDDGICVIKKSEFTELPGSAWIAEATIGEAIDAAIEFDGYWITTQYPFTFNTDTDPWVALVTPTGSLNVRRLYAQEDPLVLATDVSKVAMVRGWKNSIDIGQDHGMIVLYIKNGVPYYRTYAEQTTGSMAWEAERPLTLFSGTAVDINGFRTNDYRVGINILDSTGTTHSFITHRNWGGMASPVERIATSITDIMFEVTPITYRYTYSDDEHIETGITDVWFNVAEPIYPEVLSISNDDEYTIRIKFSHPIDYDLSTVGPAFSVKDSLNTSFNIVSTSAGVDNSELVLTLVNFNGAFGNMFVTYDRTVVELYCLNQGSRFIINSFTYEFTPDLRPPEGFAEENLNVTVTDIVFDVTQVYYSNAYNGGENLETSIMDISFVVTKVGYNPL